MVQHGGLDSASVGIKLPNGTYERPIGKNRLLRVRPGKGFSQTKGHAQFIKGQWFLYCFFVVIQKRHFWGIYLSAISCFLSRYNETKGLKEQGKTGIIMSTKKAYNVRVNTSLNRQIN